eukprot:7387125-Prymnesium_polylepis.1
MSPRPMPSQRAKQDQERLALLAAKVARNPGPGAYQPKRPPNTAEELAGSTASRRFGLRADRRCFGLVADGRFKSKSERKLDESLKEVGDPGMYSPFEGTGVGARATKSFNKSQQSGAGSFGSRTRRAELSSPNDAPGPGTYEAKEAAKPEAKQGSSFASQTKRGAYTRREATPGAGEYDTHRASRINGGESMFKNRDQRFREHAELGQQVHVGPGSYTQEHHTVAARVKRSQGKVSGWAASTSLRGDLWGL